MNYLVRVGDMSNYEVVTVARVYQVKVDHGCLFMLGTNLSPIYAFAKGQWIDFKAVR